MNDRRALSKTKPVRDDAHEATLLGVKGIVMLASHTPARWTCRHHMDGSDITAYVAASGGLEIIARTRQADGIDAQANAELIVSAVNNHEKYWPLINDLATALELCLKCEGLTWAAEQEADITLARARRVMAG